MESINILQLHEESSIPSTNGSNSVIGGSVFSGNSSEKMKNSSSSSSSTSRPASLMAYSSLVKKNDVVGEDVLEGLKATISCHRHLWLPRDETKRGKLNRDTFLENLL